MGTRVLGRLYVKELRKISDSLFKEIRKCNLGEAGEMKYHLDRYRNGRSRRRKMTVGYVLLNGTVIAVGILFRRVGVYEFQVYTKKCYRNCGVGTRIYKRMVKYPKRTEVCLTSNKTVRFYRRLNAREAESEYRDRRRSGYSPPTTNRLKHIKRRARQRYGIPV